MSLLLFWQDEPRALEKFGGGGSTTITPLGAVVVIFAILLILLLPRKRVLIPFLFFGLCIPFGCMVVIGTVHLQMLRFLVLAGLLRIWMESNRERPFFDKLHPIDKAFYALLVVSWITFILLNPERAAFANQIAVVYTTLGTYLILRFLIRNRDDVNTAVTALVYMAFTASIGMTYEKITGGKNVFAYLGGVRLDDLIRDDKIRAQAFFEHPITAGCVGATLLCFSLWLWLQGSKFKKMALLCFLSSTIMTVCAAASTSLLAYVAGWIALSFWPIRRQMRWVRRGIVGALVFLHIVMKGPVWSLIEHIDIVGGNSSFHRYKLIDLCIHHFWDWWLIGTNDNQNWGWDMWDTANYYVGTAEGYGLLPLLLLLTIITRSFRSLGLTRASFESDKKEQWMLWSLGAVLFAQCVGFFGISYFDQASVFWYALLAIIIAVTFPSIDLQSPVSNAHQVVLPSKVALVRHPSLPEISVPGKFVRRKIVRFE